MASIAAPDDALDSVIDDQLGRHHLRSEQQRYLRGKRYHLEKTSGHGGSAPQNEGQTTAEHLADA